MDRLTPPEITKLNHISAGIDRGDDPVRKGPSMEIKEIALQTNLTGSPIFRIKCGVITSDSSELLQGTSTAFPINCQNTEERGDGGHKCKHQPFLWTSNTKNLPES